MQIGLQLDEVDFFAAYEKVAKILEVGAVPWEDGLLLELKVIPLDHLYNLNELSNLRPGEDQDRGRWNYFANVMADVEIPSEIEGAEPELIGDEIVAEFYAGFYDWIDSDDENYNQFPGVSGAEAGAYFSRDPETTIKNGMLDQLSEIRLVRGVMDSRIPWEEWQSRFTTLPRSGEGGFFYPESINVNLASREEIVRFLKDHYMDPDLIEGTAFRSIQIGINKYEERAEDIARVFAPEAEEGKREVYNISTLKRDLDNLGFKDKYGINYLFSVANQYYRIRLLVEMNEIQSELDAVVIVARSRTTRVGTSVDVLQYSLR